jgi:hypothetical protein
VVLRVGPLDEGRERSPEQLPEPQLHARLDEPYAAEQQHDGLHAGYDEGPLHDARRRRLLLGTDAPSELPDGPEEQVRHLLQQQEA